MPQISTVTRIDYFNKTEKKKNKNEYLDTENRLMVQRHGGRDGGIAKWMKVVRRYKLSVIIRYISCGYIMHSTVTIVNESALYT